MSGMYTNPSNVRNVPKDLGAFQTLVAGWEQVGSRSHTPARDVYLPISPSVSDMNEITIGLPIPSPTGTPSKSLALKEQFLRDLSPTPTPAPTPTTPYSSAARTPTTPTYGGSSYRFAGVERLAQRQKIYEPQISSPEALKENLSVRLQLNAYRYCMSYISLSILINYIISQQIFPIHSIHKSVQ